MNKFKCGNCGAIRYEVDNVVAVKCMECDSSECYGPLKANKAPVAEVPCSVGLSDRAALYLEELHVSGDTMIEMDHSLENMNDDKVGSLYLHDILAGFIESETGR